MRRYIAVSLFVATAGVRLLVELLTRFTVDDAFITFRYAENIAAGLGFVYNPGQAVLGTTTPLFTLLLALLSIVGIGTVSAAYLISVPAAGATAVVLYRWADRLGLKQLAILPALLYAFFPRSISADISGMETALFTLLLALAFYQMYRKSWVAALAASSLAAVTRPEGVAVLIIVAAYSLICDRRRLLLRVIPILLILGNWLLFSWLYFGSIIPNSVTAKSALYGKYWTLGLWGSIQFLFGLSSPVGWAMLIFTLFGISVAMNRERTIVIVGLASLGYLVVLAAANTHLFFWYPAPVYPLMFLVLAFGVEKMLERVAVIRSGGLTLASAVICVIVVVAGLWQTVAKLDYLKWEMTCYRQIHRQAGRYLADHAGKNDEVLAEDIGQLGYIYHGEIIDRDGLVTPAAIPYNRAGRYRDFADSVEADWIFIALDQSASDDVLEDGALMGAYEVAKGFECEGANQYALFHKIR
jgi:hypothetical protein